MLSSSSARLLLFFLLPLLIPILFGGTRLSAQPQARPALRRRSQTQALSAMDTASRGRTTLPLDASGEYLLGGAGEVVEIDLETNRLTGYVTRLGSRAADRGAPSTFFFATSSLNGQQLRAFLL